MLPGDDAFVFNVVWTGNVFPYLRPFVASQIAQSGARFRFVANGCPVDQIECMERYAAEHADRVVEVLDVSSEMIPHGAALDRVRDRRDDGEFFCLIDPDIKANAPFLADFAGLLADGCAAVTSGKEIWSADNFVPAGSKGVAGQHFFDRDGFVFGSPHLALYRRDALEATAQRWNVGFGSGGDKLRADAREQLAEMGLPYIVYDTAKLVNVFLQADGARVVHRDLPQLLHIGGLAHYLAPTGYVTDDDGDTQPNWSRWLDDPNRYDVARFTALTLRELGDRAVAPEIPAGADPDEVQRLSLVRREMIDLVERYGVG